MPRVDDQIEVASLAGGIPSRGARSKRDVNLAYLRLLDAGVAQSRTHVEQMAMSPTALIRLAFPSIEIDEPQFEALPFITRLRVTGSLLCSEFGADLDRVDRCWVSDTVRGWLAMSIASDEARSFSQVIRDLLPVRSG
jgi:hypothetical protein